MMTRSPREQILIRVRIAFLFVVLFTIAIIIRLWHIQQIQGEKWLKLDTKRHFKTKSKQATRGNIYAADGSLLATTIPKYKLGIDLTVGRSYIDKKGKTLRKKQAELFKTQLDTLSRILSWFYGDLSAREYKVRLQDAHDNLAIQYITINNRLLDYQHKEMLRQLPFFREGKLKSGLVFDETTIRYMPFGELAARTIGSYNKKDGSGAGLERSYNRDLAGTNGGKGVFQVLSGGYEKPLDDDAVQQPINGLDIYTTLNINIQDVAEASLRVNLKKHRAKYGTAVVMEVATGQIKAMANLTRQPNDTTYAEESNYAISDRTDPGSVFKLATMAALFEEEKIALSDPVFIDRGYVYYAPAHRTIEDSHTNATPTTLTVQEVFEKSSNVGVFRLMEKYFFQKPDRYLEYLDKFRLTEKVGSQIWGEQQPIFYRRSSPKWSAGTLVQMAYGYESGISPLQLLTFYNAIANNGYWVQPILVKETKRGSDLEDDFMLSQRKSTEPICSENTLTNLRKMLIGVVERGTARNIKSSDYLIAGKTGTARKLIGGKYEKGHFHTSFIGFFPANTPKYSCIVVIDDPQGTNEERLMAADIAAPVFRDIADKIFSTDVSLHKAMKLEKKVAPILIPQLDATHGVDIAPITKNLEITYHGKGWNDVAQNKNRVPNVRGMSLRDALYILENKGFKVNHTGRGKVAQQSLSAGSIIYRNKLIGLVLQ